MMSWSNITKSHIFHEISIHQKHIVWSTYKTKLNKKPRFWKHVKFHLKYKLSFNMLQQLQDCMRQGDDACVVVAQCRRCNHGVPHPWQQCGLHLHGRIIGASVGHNGSLIKGPRNPRSSCCMSQRPGRRLRKHMRSLITWWRTHTGHSTTPCSSFVLSLM